MKRTSQALASVEHSTLKDPHLTEHLTAGGGLRIRIKLRSGKWAAFRSCAA